MADQPNNKGNNRNQNQGQPQKPTRRFNPTDFWLDLGINVLESKSERWEREGGLDVTGLSLLGDKAKASAKTYLAKNESLLPWIESGFKALLFTALPLPPEAKTAVDKVLDLYTDGLRRALELGEDGDGEKKEAIVMGAGSELKSNLDKVIGEFTAKRKAKLSFEELFNKASPATKTELGNWMPWVSLNSKQYASEWRRFRKLITSEKMLEELAGITADSAPFAFNEEGRSAFEMRSVTVKRMHFLEGVYGEEPTARETLMAFLAGEETPYTKRLAEHTQKAKDDASQSLQKSEAEIVAINARNKLKWTLEMTVALLAVIACGLVGAITILGR